MTVFGAVYFITLITMKQPINEGEAADTANTRSLPFRMLDLNHQIDGIRRC
ncbi:hypothetical protein D910_11286 [Dendroctonus ponderosae]|uniref:Uncharacterized protein n=1 Tax=Dendroctonus ponderosae TaxID=77166 RepID=U4UUV9_DENPD|nr:hypothetical protein D910_11286 [Dendroctonus ponderosae]